MSLLSRLQKLIRHEQSARLIGSVAEADAFATKVEQLKLRHRPAHDGMKLHFPELGGDGQSCEVPARDIGIPARRSRQEWSERLAFASARAFNCELHVTSATNTVVFRGRRADRLSAACLYAELARNAYESCRDDFAGWKKRMATRCQSAANSRRWKQSFLLGFSTAVCETFICGEHCPSRCRHSLTLQRKDAQHGIQGARSALREIGGMRILYDGFYLGQERARTLTQQFKAGAA